MENNPKYIKFEITQDKIIDLVLHAATRDDVTALAKETREDVARLYTKIDALAKTIQDDIARLNTKIDMLTKTTQ